MIAIGSLAGNLRQMKKQLREMQEQQRLQNRGYLAIIILEFSPIAKTPESDVHSVKIGYKTQRTTRIPLLIQGEEWRITQVEDIDIDAWFSETKSKYAKGKEKPLIPETKYSSTLIAPDFAKGWARFHIEKPYPSKEVSFYIHCIFGYKDALDDDYWVYIRWCSRFITSKDIPEGDVRIDASNALEEYRYLNY